MDVRNVILAALVISGANAGSSCTNPPGANFSGSTVATWWGGGQASDAPYSLEEVCAQPVDLVSITFYDAVSPPSLQLGLYSWKASQAQVDANYTNLKDLTPPASNVSTHVQGCQQAGVKVVLALGGDPNRANTTFPSSQDAQAAARLIWNLFLGGNDHPELRPFGKDVVLDALNIDNEMGSSMYYSDFTSTLRGLMDADTSKTYLLGASPWVGSLGSDPATISVPTGIFGMLDYVAVQFYNANDGGLGTDTFDKWLGNWASAIHEANANTKILVGVMVPGAGDSGLWAQNTSEIHASLKAVKEKKIQGFGGVAVWEAGMALNYSEDYILRVADAVGSPLAEPVSIEVLI